MSSLASGRNLRSHCPRSRHAELGQRRHDPLQLLEHSNQLRVAALLPMRHGRMLQSPFAFFRATALLQAHDLAGTSDTGIKVQCCGDAHLMNFGGFATPERNLVFDLNDFDETDSGPWEWDLKRLATSGVLAARHLGLAPETARQAAWQVADSYRIHMGQYATMSRLDTWYDKLTFERLREACGSESLRQRLSRAEERARGRTHDSLLDKLTERAGAAWRLRDAPPELFHLHGSGSLLDLRDQWLELPDWHALVQHLFKGYRSTLQADRRALLDHYQVADLAFKVVGVGSVGTRCLVLLMQDGQGHPLFLQVKEAGPSVLALAGQRGQKGHQGQRVVEGQRLMQAASDAFLGWCKGPAGRHFYVRQLRDMKVSAQLERFDEGALQAYLRACAWALARAHARSSGLAAPIAGYLGKSASFTEAIASYGMAYADQVEADYRAFQQAVAHGRFPLDTQDDARYERVP
ncbi:DUF2252 domain-containing protein [Chitinimonas sp.]|uniref:DUF2252 domain-containing protein n=1 Tax=Chitinimonas sp. TaxID=1934313 RepID=UPI002F92222D